MYLLNLWGLLMNRLFQLGKCQLFLSTMLILAFLAVVPKNAVAQDYVRPALPVLSLTKSDGGYDKIWYPDGRIRIPVTKSGETAREFLMPVFIDNKWLHYTENENSRNLYIPDNIYSFEFKILFDAEAVMPVGVETIHPFPDKDDPRVLNYEGYYYEPFAKDFEIQWNVYKNMEYTELFFPGDDEHAPTKTRERGKSIKIIGKSSAALPNTASDAEDFGVLLYVRFKVLMEKDLITVEQRESLLSPIHISTDSIMYGMSPDYDSYTSTGGKTINVRTEAPFEDLRKLYPFVFDHYNDPDIKAGLAGMDNSTIDILWNTTPILPGCIYMNITEELPKFGYQIFRKGYAVHIYDWENTVGLPEFADNPVPEGTWILRDPVTVDSAKNDPNHQFGRYDIQLKNESPQTRMTDIQIESDSPWLEFRIITDGPKVPTKNFVRKLQFINFIDNQILGSMDDMNKVTSNDPSVFLDIKCDPDAIVPENGATEEAGVYIGWITISSKTADISPIRLRITFINFRNPVEPGDETRGIALTLENSRGVDGDRTDLLFGTGHRASKFTDILFGEAAATTMLPDVPTEMHARFYCLSEEEAADNDLGLGFGNIFPHNDFDYGDEGFVESRDIRSADDTTESHIYLVRFNAGGAANYPVVISWDINDFPEDAELYLSDTLSGALFNAVNMRHGTQIGQSTIHTFAIQDPKVKSFKIEYTTPRVIRYLDANGDAKIKKGWNLLSLPVRPKNMEWENIYVHGKNKPWSFSYSGWQENDVLKPGVGYFVKYDAIVDDKFSGLTIRRLTPDFREQGNNPDEDSYSDKIKIYPGWNTIGTLTMPVSTKYIEFDPFDNQTGATAPTNRFVLENGVWAYYTDRGYEEVAVLLPGSGYWIKADTVDSKVGGYLKLVDKGIAKLAADQINPTKYDLIAKSTNFIFRDNAQHEKDFYVSSDKDAQFVGFTMPPVPPTQVFDARFANGMYITNNDSEVLRLQGVEYPLSITVVDADVNYTFVDPVSGEVFGTVEAGTTGNVEINSTVTNAVKIQTSENTDVFSVAVRPNPVVASTTISFTLTESQNVIVTLFDALGNNVMEIANDEFTNGTNTINLDATNLVSGRYMCKFTAGNNTTIIPINVIK